MSKYNINCMGQNLNQKFIYILYPNEHGMLPQRKQGQVPKNPLPPSKPQ